MDSAQDSFILRLYRQKNKEGFIKAFSASPVSFSAGFCQVWRILLKKRSSFATKGGGGCATFWNQKKNSHDLSP